MLRAPPLHDRRAAPHGSPGATSWSRTRRERRCGAPGPCRRASPRHASGALATPPPQPGHGSGQVELAPVESHWLPPGAWQALAADYTIEAGEAVFVGVDVGGSRAASAVVWVTADLRVGCRVYQGTDAVLAVAESVRALAHDFDLREVAYDPWRFQQAALELERDGLRVVEFPQSQARMVAASERLHAAVVEGRLSHPNDSELNQHVAQAVAKSTPRGWRLDKSSRTAQIDAVVALAMAVERAEQPQPKPTRLIGWIE